MRSILARVDTTASFPNPAQDYYDGPLSLEQHLMPHPLSTFVMRVVSDVLVSVGIYSGDEVLVDRALDPYPGRILIVVADGEHRIGRFEMLHGQAVLVTDQETIPLTSEVTPWGVATIALRHLPGGPPAIQSA